MGGILFFQTFPVLVYLLRESHDELASQLLVDKNAWLKTIAEDGKRTFEGWSKFGKSNASLFHLTMSMGACFMIDWPLKETYTW